MLSYTNASITNASEAVIRGVRWHFGVSRKKRKEEEEEKDGAGVGTGWRRWFMEIVVLCSRCTKMNGRAFSKIGCGKDGRRAKKKLDRSKATLRCC